MNFIIENILAYKYIYIGFLALILVITILLIIFKPKKVKPIEITIDDKVDNDKKEKNEIEKVIEALEENKTDRPMTTFEEEQEANAIISYQELVQAVNEKRGHLDNKTAVKKVEAEIPKELLNYEEEEKQPPKFKNSEFISPIFGKDSNNDDFLKELKNFRNNL